MRFHSRKRRPFLAGVDDGWTTPCGAAPPTPAPAVSPESAAASCPAASSTRRCQPMPAPAQPRRRRPVPSAYISRRASPPRPPRRRRGRRSRRRRIVLHLAQAALRPRGPAPPSPSGFEADATSRKSSSSSIEKTVAPPPVAAAPLAELPVAAGASASGRGAARSGRVRRRLRVGRRLRRALRVGSRGREMRRNGRVPQRAAVLVEKGERVVLWRPHQVVRHRVGAVAVERIRNVELPQEDLLVETAGGEVLPVGRPGDERDLLRVAVE